MTNSEAIKYGKEQLEIFSGQHAEFIRMAIEALSAQRTGEWIHDGSDWTNRWICSKCGYKHFLEKTNYCPNCGADMRGGDTNGSD